MVVQQNDSALQTKKIGNGRILETQQTVPQETTEKNIPDEYVLEFMSRHHLNSLWDEFVYEKNHPKIPLSAREVWEMIYLPPEEQEKILKEHE
jgi:hypothetical protein